MKRLVYSATKRIKRKKKIPCTTAFNIKMRRIFRDTFNTDTRVTFESSAIVKSTRNTRVAHLIPKTKKKCLFR